MKKRYFTVNVSNGNSEHIGTAVMDEENDVLFTEKIKNMCEEHFDADVKIPSLKIEDYIHGRSGTVQISVDSTEEFVDEIFIEETWLY